MNKQMCPPCNDNCNQSRSCPARLNQCNSDKSDQGIEMEPDNWTQIYLYGRDLLICVCAVAACAAIAGYVVAKFFN